jgi:hypothetical protein
MYKHSKHDKINRGAEIGASTFNDGDGLIEAERWGEIPQLTGGGRNQRSSQIFTAFSSRNLAFPRPFLNEMCVTDGSGDESAVGTLHRTRGASPKARGDNDGVATPLESLAVDMRDVQRLV